MKRTAQRLMLHLLPFLVSAATASAQTAAEHLRLGNKTYDTPHADSALVEYEAALSDTPQNYEVLWRAAITGVDLGEYASPERQRVLYKTAEQRARLAVQVKPTDAEGHFALAAALGRTALAASILNRVKYATEIHDQALACLKINPQHVGCMHTMGLWHAEVMRLSGPNRLIAQHMLGGQVLGEASWDSAQYYLTTAVAKAPRRIDQRLDLGRVYADRGMKAEARTQFQAVINSELLSYNDAHYKVEAAKALKAL